MRRKSELSRPTYLRIKEEDRETFGVGRAELLELIKPFYGICNAGNYWDMTIDAHIVNNLDMRTLISDPALHWKFDDKNLQGLSEVEVDDCLKAGNDQLKSLTQQTLQKFEYKPLVYDSFELLWRSDKNFK